MFPWFMFVLCPVLIRFLEGILKDKVASLQVPSDRFARTLRDTFEISLDHRVPSQGATKQVINVDNVYRILIDLFTQFKADESGSKSKVCKHPSLQDPRKILGL